jgi:hypothetical protein
MIFEQQDSYPYQTWCVQQHPWNWSTFLIFQC